jgi:hypothetical protein
VAAAEIEPGFRGRGRLLVLIELPPVSAPRPTGGRGRRAGRLVDLTLLSHDAADRDSLEGTRGPPPLSPEP